MLLFPIIQPKPTYPLKNYWIGWNPLPGFILWKRREVFCQDSVNLQPQQWPELAQRIYDCCDRYDGIVVTHGTDTMAYTAAMLSFMLHRIPIPVVLTGAQRPLIHPESDGLSNLHCAFAMAASGIGGVFVAFHSHVILGSHAVKSRCSSFHAFESVGIPWVAALCSHGLVIYKENIPHQDGTKNLQLSMCDKVFLWKLSPASHPSFADDLIQAGIRGVVIEGYGKGHLPNKDRTWQSAFEKFQAHQIPVVLCGRNANRKPQGFGAPEISLTIAEYGPCLAGGPCRSLL